MFCMQVGADMTGRVNDRLTAYTLAMATVIWWRPLACRLSVVLRCCRSSAVSLSADHVREEYVCETGRESVGQS